MKRVAGLAAGAVWLMACLPVVAQDKQTSFLTDEQKEELYCVYDLMDTLVDGTALTDGYLSGNRDAPAYKALMKEIESMAAVCADEYVWDGSQSNTAMMIGVYDTITDDMERRLASYGLDEDQIDAVFATADFLPDDAMRKFALGGWQDDAVILGRLYATYREYGLTGDKALADAARMTEAYVMSTMLTADWRDSLPEN